METDNTCDLTSRFRAVNTSLWKVEDVELVFAPAMLSPSVPPHSYFHAFLAWSGSGSTERLLAELGSHPFTCTSFTWLRLHTSASAALSPVSSSAEPPCLKFPSWPNQLCLHSLLFKVSSRNTHLQDKVSKPQSSYWHHQRNRRKKQTTPYRPTKAWKSHKSKCSVTLPF